MRTPIPHIRRGFIALAVGLGSACEGSFTHPMGDPTPLPELSLFGDRVEMAVGEGLDVCGGSFEYIDRFIEIYGESSSSGHVSVPVEYYYLDYDTIHRPDICGVSSACARRGVVYAQSPINTHEVVHAIRQIQHGGASPGTRFFEEGIAQWHYPVRVGWDEAFSMLDLPDTVEQNMPASLYDPAAHVLSVVAVEDSVERAERLVDASAAIEVAEDVEPVVEQVLGVDLEELEAIYSAYPDCSAAARSRMLVECTAEPRSWIEAPWSSAPYLIEGIGMLSCDDQRVIGPVDERLWVFYTIEVSTDGNYELEVADKDGQRLVLTSCDDTCGADADLRWDDANRREGVMLTAGRYVIRLGRELGDDNGVGFHLSGPLL